MHFLGASTFPKVITLDEADSMTWLISADLRAFYIRSRIESSFCVSVGMMRRQPYDESCRTGQKFTKTLMKNRNTFVFSFGVRRSISMIQNVKKNSYNVGGSPDCGLLSLQYSPKRWQDSPCPPTKQTGSHFFKGFFSASDKNCEHKAPQILQTEGESRSMFCDPPSAVCFKAYLLCRDSPPLPETSPPSIEIIEKQLLPPPKTK